MRTTIYTEIGLFNIIILTIILFRINSFRKSFHDFKLFSRFIFSIIIVNIVDTVGWIIDGKMLFGSNTFAYIIDGLDMIATITVCWCWFKYSVFLATGDKSRRTIHNIYNDSLLLINYIYIILGALSRHIYMIDSNGIYHRTSGYWIYMTIGFIQVLYSCLLCVIKSRKSKDVSQRKELLLVAHVLLIPVFGTIIQSFFAAYPAMWSCVTVVVLMLYIHIQDKRMERIQKEKQRELSKAIIAKNEFLSRMSHDMRTPMNGILGIASLSEKETDARVLLSNITKIKESGEYLLELINDTLDFQKIESGQLCINPQTLYIENLVNGIVEIVRPAIEEKHIDFRLITKNTDLRCYVKADSIRLKQVFINLLSNAIKFTPEGGIVEFIFECTSRDSMFSHAKIQIADTGIGMSEDFLKNGLYKPFSQEYNGVSTQYVGSGLGLSITKKLLELMNGRIEVKSSKDVGTTFTIYIDFQHINDEEVDSDSTSFLMHQEEILSSLSGINVLLVEDHPLNAEISKALLENAGCNVIWKENGLEAVKEFESSSVNYYNVVLMDIRMPIMDGFEATNRIRALDRADTSSIPIIALTANAYEQDITLALQCGMNAHIAKPINTDVMYETISRCLSNVSG